MNIKTHAHQLATSSHKCRPCSDTLPSAVSNPSEPGDRFQMTASSVFVGSIPLAGAYTNWSGMMSSIEDKNTEVTMPAAFGMLSNIAGTASLATGLSMGSGPMVGLGVGLLLGSGLIAGYGANALT